MGFVATSLDPEHSAGATVADHARRSLANYIDEALSKTLSNSQETYQSAIQDAIDREDQDADREDWKDGSTLALALIDTAQRTLIEADIGDSHVVLAEHTKRNKREQHKLNKLDPALRAHNFAKVKNEWNITRLSTPHDPEDPSERKRITDAGGEVKYDSTGTARIGKCTPALYCLYFQPHRRSILSNRY